MDRMGKKGGHHINILVKDSKIIFTKENNYISTLVFRKMDEIATTFVYYAYNEMALTKHNNHYYNHSETQYLYANEYPLLTQFGIPIYLLNSTNRDTIRSILRDI